MKRIGMIWALVWLAATFTMIGCSKEDIEVISAGDLDRIPALITVIDGATNYEPGNVALVLINTLPGKVRTSRAPAQVLAVFSKKRGWLAPGPELKTELSALDYQFLLKDSFEEAGLAVPRELGNRIEIGENSAGVKWFRLGRDKASIKIEISFATDPTTVRKIQYYTDGMGYTSVMEKGALLKIKEKR